LHDSGDITLFNRRAAMQFSHMRGQKQVKRMCPIRSILLSFTSRGNNTVQLNCQGSGSSSIIGAACA
jgi:hypothetical protein